MSELFRIIDGWKDLHGQPSDASIARSIGTTEQTFNSWRKKGFKTVPRNKEPLRNLALFMGVSYEEVIIPALAFDIGLLDEAPGFEWPEPEFRARHERGVS